MSEELEDLKRELAAIKGAEGTRRIVIDKMPDGSWQVTSHIDRASVRHVLPHLVDRDRESLMYAVYTGINSYMGLRERETLEPHHDDPCQCESVDMAGITGDDYKIVPATAFGLAWKHRRDACRRPIQPHPPRSTPEQLAPSEEELRYGVYRVERAVYDALETVLRTVHWPRSGVAMEGEDGKSMGSGFGFGDISIFPPRKVRKDEQAQIAPKEK